MVRKFWGSVHRWITLNDFYQEAHGPHPFPEKQFQSNKHIFAKLCLYHNFDCENKYYLLIENWMHLICKTLKDALCQVWLKLAQWFCRKMIIWKVYDDDRHFDQKSSLSLWLKRHWQLTLFRRPVRLTTILPFLWSSTISNSPM